MQPDAKPQRLTQHVEQHHMPEGIAQIDRVEVAPGRKAPRALACQPIRIEAAEPRIRNTGAEFGKVHVIARFGKVHVLLDCKNACDWLTNIKYSARFRGGGPLARSGSPATPRTGSPASAPRAPPAAPVRRGWR